jgi:hypothetical protein
MPGFWTPAARSVLNPPASNGIRAYQPSHGRRANRMLMRSVGPCRASRNCLKIVVSPVRFWPSPLQFFLQIGTFLEAGLQRRLGGFGAWSPIRSPKPPAWSASALVDPLEIRIERLDRVESSDPAGRDSSAADRVAGTTAGWPFSGGSRPCLPEHRWYGGRQWTCLGWSIPLRSWAGRLAQFGRSEAAMASLTLSAHMRMIRSCTGAMLLPFLLAGRHGARSSG